VVKSHGVSPKDNGSNDDGLRAEDYALSVDKNNMDRNKRAVKADDAAIPEYLWNDILVPDEKVTGVRALGILRSFVLRWWRCNIRKEFVRWFFTKYKMINNSLKQCTKTFQLWNSRFRVLLKSTPEALKDWTAGRDCIARCCNSTWWDWLDGSRPHFWRWCEEYRIQIRDGVPPWFKRRLPRWQVPQRLERNVELREAMRKKLEKVRRLRYVCPGNVKSLTSFFAVPKGDSDIRMVYDGTKSGLNDALWAPWFTLPTIEGHLRFVETDTFMGDIDIGDMFHNFILHDDIRCVAGIDLTSLFPEELIARGDINVLWEHWTRCGMGFKPSPYYSIQGIIFAEEHIRGDPRSTTNVFRWDTV
jgi:hypothetical protein